MKRPKKILKRTGIVLGSLVAIGLVANAVFVWTTDTRLERQLAEIRAAGDPVTLADLARPPIPPEQNAATYLHQAKADAEAMEDEVWAVPEVQEYSISRVRPMPLKVYETLKAALAAYPNVMPLLEQAAVCQDYDLELDYSLPPQEFLDKSLDAVNKCRSPARALYRRAQLLLADGNRDEAVRTALVIFRLARHFDRNPTMVGYLIAIAVRGYAIASANEALETGPISKDVRDALDAELAIQERMDGFVWAMKSERAYVLESFAAGDLVDAANPFATIIVPGRNCWFVGRGIWNMQESACLELFPPLIDLARNPEPYRETEQTIDGESSFMASMLYPALKATYAAVARARAQIRCLRVLNAIQTHVPAESDEVPKLTELGLPVETTTDPFTGEPLHVKKTPQGWLVYSVGENFQDDGGKLDNNIDVGVGPPPPSNP